MPDVLGDNALEFLPGYSPHLNLIERVWKFIRATALKNRFLEDLSGRTS